MGHPDRKVLRQRKKEKRARLTKKNNVGILDLTPYNAVRLICSSRSDIVYR